MSMAMINSVRLVFVTWRETAVEAEAEKAVEEAVEEAVEDAEEDAEEEEGGTFDWLGERVRRAAKLNKVLVNSGVCESTNW